MHVERWSSVSRPKHWFSGSRGKSFTFHSHRHALHSTVGVKINPRAFASELDFCTTLRELSDTEKRPFDVALHKGSLGMQYPPDPRHHTTPSLSCQKESRDHSRFSTAHSREPSHVHLQRSSMDKCALHKHCRVGGTQHPLPCCCPPHSEPMLRRCQLHRPHRTSRHKFLLHRSPLHVQVHLKKFRHGIFPHVPEGIVPLWPEPLEGIFPSVFCFWCRRGRLSFLSLIASVSRRWITTETT